MVQVNEAEVMVGVGAAGLRTHFSPEVLRCYRRMLLRKDDVEVKGIYK